MCRASLWLSFFFWGGSGLYNMWLWHSFFFFENHFFGMIKHEDWVNIVTVCKHFIKSPVARNSILYRATSFKTSFFQCGSKISHVFVWSFNHLWVFCFKADSLEACKGLCAETAGCKGIEYHMYGRCEIWLREDGIQASKAAAGYTCLRFIPWKFALEWCSDIDCLYFVFDLNVELKIL